MVTRRDVIVSSASLAGIFTGGTVLSENYPSDEDPAVIEGRFGMKYTIARGPCEDFFCPTARISLKSLGDADYALVDGSYESDKIRLEEVGKTIRVEGESVQVYAVKDGIHGSGSEFGVVEEDGFTNDTKTEEW